MHSHLELLVHKNHKKGSPKGMIYKLTVNPVGDKKMNFTAFLGGTSNLHSEIIHIMVPHENTVSVTIPAVHKPKKVYDLIVAFLSAGINCSSSSFSHNLIGIKQDWPEYVLWPDNPQKHFLDYCEEIRSRIIELQD